MVLVSENKKTSKAEWMEWLGKVRNFTLNAYLFCDDGSDERPYLEIELCGETIKCLLDSGASRTIVGRAGLDIIEKHNLSKGSCNGMMVVTANRAKVQVKCEV